MSKEKLEDLSNEKLKKRKNLIVTVLTVVTVAVILDAAALVYLIIIGDLSDLTFLFPGLLCIFFILLFYVSFKEVNTKLNNKNKI